jgi:type VI secretion system protein ImpG
VTSSKYYIDELTYLRELGREFALAHPQAAPLLAEAGTDPDVERLLEGFAFLTAQLREKLDDEQGYYNQQLIQLLWPQYLRPIPSATVVQFTALPRIARETKAIPAGTQVGSRPVDGTSCTFTTTSEVVLSPLSLSECELRTVPSPQLRLRLRTLPGTGFNAITQDRLRIYLTGERAVTRALYVCLLGCLKGISLRRADGTVVDSALRVEPVGFSEEEALVPGMERSFPGLRLVQEYLAFPQKFMFVDIVGIRQLQALGSAGVVDLVFELDRLPTDMPPVSAANVQLQCTPAVNVFPHEADPIRYDPRRTTFKLRPAGADPRHFEVYRIESVRGIDRSSGESRDYRPMLRPGRRGDDRLFYFSSFAPSPVGEGNDQYLGLVDERDGGGPQPAVLAASLTCTNGQLPTRLGPGDIVQPTAATATLASVRNITRPTPSYPSPAPGELYWRLIANFGLSHRSLCSVDALCELVRIYDFPALVDRQLERTRARMLEGIEGVDSQPATRLYRGAPVRGVSVSVRLSEEHFGGEGEIFLFGSILNELLANSVSLNSFSRLQVVGTRFSEVFAWPARIGRRSIL